MKVFSKIFPILLVLLTLSSFSYAEEAETAELIPGSYIVGIDIAAGSYNLIPDMGGDEDQLWSFVIWLNANSKDEYAAAKSKNTSESKTDPSLYMIEADYTSYFLSNRPMRITLTDGQVMELAYVRYSGKLRIMISKAENIFID